MVGRFREGFDDIIPLRDLRLRVCLAGLSEGPADAAAMVKGFNNFRTGLRQLRFIITRRYDGVVVWVLGC